MDNILKDKHRRLIWLLTILCLVFLGMGLGYNTVTASTLEGTTIVVTTTNDEINDNGMCSLREAIKAANTDTPVDTCEAGNGRDTIRLPMGTFKLTLPGIDDDDGLTGDLDINSPIIITGSSDTGTIINANKIDRAFHMTGAHKVKIATMTIRNGNVDTGLFGGAGILNENIGGDLELRNVVLRDNTASYPGGGFENIGTARLTDVTAMDNSGSKGGAILNAGTIVLTNVTLANNTATDTGAGFDNGNYGTLINVTISENTAAIEGGGIFNDGNLTILNSTLANNSTGIVNKGAITFKNTVVADSIDENCAGTGSFTSNGYNLDSEDTCKFDSVNDLVNTDPLLGPLQDNGGRTKTHALLEGSPAIDTADNLDCPDIDQRGAYRPADGNDDGTKTCDMGTYEYKGEFPSMTFMPIVGR
jgi:CSLREA domain-containing protein